MPILQTAMQHFIQDIERARDLLLHSREMQPGSEKNDVLRAAWMMAVGGCDAYFSDAYADLVARTLRAKNDQPEIQIPDRLNNLRIPVIAVIRPSGDGWRWRMAARELIENENVLSLDKIRQLFNHFFSRGHKIINKDTIETWLLHRDTQTRLFGFTGTHYRRLSPEQKDSAKEDMLEHFEKRYQSIFQRRHDCIHNCDRPKVAVRPIGDVQVEKVISDVEFLVQRCQESDFLAEFPLYLGRLGFNAITRNSVCV